MRLREWIADCAGGNNLGFFWRLYQWRQRSKSRLTRDFFTFFMSRSARRHGGYVGPGALLRGIPSMPHGLHGVYISRYAVIGESCRIYQNVTIGEVDGRALCIADGCLIGAGAVVLGGIQIGQHVRIGAGAVVCTDVPPHCTVVAQMPRVLSRGETE